PNPVVRAAPARTTAPGTVAGQWRGRKENEELMNQQDARLGVGMIGYAFMGAAHSQAWRVAPRFFDLPLRTEMTVVAGRSADRVQAAAARLGWAEAETDWRRLLERDDVDVIDI